MDGLTFEQWVLFLAVSFRSRYLATARSRFPELEPRLPLANGGKLTVVQVNAGEAVHFIYRAAEPAGATACRALTVEPPDGLGLRDWALLHEEGYLRFVERSVGAAPAAGHFVVYPGEGNDHAEVVLAADRIARDHAAALR